MSPSCHPHVVMRERAALHAARREDNRGTRVMNEGQGRTCDVEHVAHHGAVVPTPPPHHQQAACASSSGLCLKPPPLLLHTPLCCCNVYGTRRDWCIRDAQPHARYVTWLAGRDRRWPGIDLARARQGEALGSGADAQCGYTACVVGGHLPQLRRREAEEIMMGRSL